MSDTGTANTSTSDTSTIVRITSRDLQWLVFAVRNVQTRNAGEMAVRGELTARFDTALEENPQLPEFVFGLVPLQLRICLWAANEGNCRDCEEMLIRGRMQRTFQEACGVPGVNGLV